MLFVYILCVLLLFLLMQLTGLIPGISLGTASAASSVLTVAAFFLLRKYFKIRFERLFSNVSVRLLVLCVPLTLAAMFFMNVCMEALSLPDKMQATFIQISRTPVGFLAIALLGPVCEEVTFRGVLQGYLQQRLRPWMAVFISAFLFGLIHGNPAQIPFAFALGLLLGWLFLRSGSLWPGLLAHVINNTVGASMMAFSSQPDATIEETLGTTVMWTLTAVSLLVFLLFLYMVNKNYSLNNKQE